MIFLPISEVASAYYKAKKDDYMHNTSFLYRKRHADEQGWHVVDKHWFLRNAFDGHKLALSLGNVVHIPGTSVDYVLWPANLPSPESVPLPKTFKVIGALNKIK